MFRARYRLIVWFFARILLSFAIWDLLLPRIGLRKLALRNRSERFRHSAASFRGLAVRMGGVLIKVGQFLSARVDIMPVEVTRELEGLQDEVPPESFDDIRRLAEVEYGMPLGEKFLAFDKIPLAAASLGQVHLARVSTVPWQAPDETIQQPPPGEAQGVEVVVKIQRPNIEKLIATDLAALRTVGKWLSRYPPIRKRADIPALLAEFTRILYEEIDYMAEGRNAETFGANFEGRAGIRVPRVVWSHTTRRALTLENVLAIKITDYQAIAEAGVSRAEVASRLLNIYLQQIFEDAFFHADPHPGNLFVNPLSRKPGDSLDSPRPWELTFVDFGMVGHVPSNLLAGLREMLIGVGTREAARVVKAYQMMDVLLPSADLALLEKAEAKAFEHWWGKNMSELASLSAQDVKEFTDEFRELLYEMPFQIPQNLIFLGRCVGILSGMCTGLDPQFNLWIHLAPYARKILAEETRESGQNWFTELERLARVWLSIPLKMDTTLSKLERGEIAVRTPEVTHQAQRLERAIYRATGGVIFAALLLGGIQLYLANQVAFGAVLLAGAGLNLAWLLLNGRKKTR
jgi:predicted unusual protein kinase regulating ubiquinone biosynthesis (AarF/ABC1/UbiB family)